MSERKILLLLCLMIAVGASAMVATSGVLFAAGRTPEALRTVRATGQSFEFDGST